jgi:hypothetical protein
MNEGSIILSFPINKETLLTWISILGDAHNRCIKGVTYRMSVSIKVEDIDPADLEEISELLEGNVLGISHASFEYLYCLPKENA